MTERLHKAMYACGVRAAVAAHAMYVAAEIRRLVDGPAPPTRAP